MDEAAITRYIVETFEGVDVLVASQQNGAPEAAWGDSFFYSEPARPPAPHRRWPFATIVVKDYRGFDTASNLNRPGVFRLNIGLGRETFRSLFGDVAAGAHDYTALDRLLPHPVYAAQHWVSILNPSAEGFAAVQLLLAEAHGRSKARRATAE